MAQAKTVPSLPRRLVGSGGGMFVYLVVLQSLDQDAIHRAHVEGVDVLCPSAGGFEALRSVALWQMRDRVQLAVGNEFMPSIQSLMRRVVSTARPGASRVPRSARGATSRPPTATHVLMKR